MGSEKDKNRKYINYVVDQLASETKIKDIGGLIDTPFAQGVKIASLYTNLRHVQEWNPILYRKFRKYIRDMYGVLDKELELVWNLYCGKYIKLQFREKMLKEQFNSLEINLDRIVDRLITETHYNGIDFTYSWMNFPSPHVPPLDLTTRHYYHLAAHLKDLYEIRNGSEVQYIWKNYYRKLLRKYHQ